jgi:hypothetical protein
MSAIGGNHPFIFWLICLSFVALAELGAALQVWFLGMNFLAIVDCDFGVDKWLSFLGYWARQYELHDDPSEVSVP